MVAWAGRGAGFNFPSDEPRGTITVRTARQPYPLTRPHRLKDCLRTQPRWTLADLHAFPAGLMPTYPHTFTQLVGPGGWDGSARGRAVRRALQVLLAAAEPPPIGILAAAWTLGGGGGGAAAVAAAAAAAAPGGGPPLGRPGAAAGAGARRRPRPRGAALPAAAGGGAGGGGGAGAAGAAAAGAAAAAAAAADVLAVEYATRYGVRHLVAVANNRKANEAASDTARLVLEKLLCCDFGFWASVFRSGLGGAVLKDLMQLQPPPASAAGGGGGGGGPRGSGGGGGGAAAAAFPVTFADPMRWLVACMSELQGARSAEEVVVSALGCPWGSAVYEAAARQWRAAAAAAGRPAWRLRAAVGTPRGWPAARQTLTVRRRGLPLMR